MEKIDLINLPNQNLTALYPSIDYCHIWTHNPSNKHSFIKHKSNTLLIDGVWLSWL